MAGTYQARDGREITEGYVIDAEGYTRSARRFTYLDGTVRFFDANGRLLSLSVAETFDKFSPKRKEIAVGVRVPLKKLTGTYLVPFLGDGGDAVLLTVSYLADFPRGIDGLCAYCHGDPVAETSGPGTLIGDYYRRNSWAQTCPLCGGRPS